MSLVLVQLAFATQRLDESQFLSAGTMVVDAVVVVDVGDSEDAFPGNNGTECIVYKTIQKQL